MPSITFRTGWLVAGIVLGATSCARDAVSPYPDRGGASAHQDVAATTDNVAIQWDNAALQAIRVAKLGPPIVARALAIVHTVMYDAWAAYDDRAVGTRLGGSLRRPGVERTLASKNEAVSFAAYRALVDLFPTQTPSFNDVLASLGYDLANGSTDVATPAGVGNVAATAVIAFRHHDGANQLGDLHPGAYSDYTGYVPVNDPDHINDPNRWQPLRFSDGHGGTVTPGFIAPHWGRVVPFALTSGSQFRPPEVPNLYPFGGYRVQAEQILHYSARLTDTQKAIAEYWADGPNSAMAFWVSAQYSAMADRHPESHRRVLGRRPELGAAAGSLDAVRAVRFATGRAHAGPRREDVLRLGERGVRRRHRCLGLQARLRLCSPRHGSAFPVRWQEGARVGGPVSRNAGHRRSRLGAVPAGHVCHAALPGIHLWPQRFQRRGGGGPEGVHRQRRVRRVCDCAGGELEGGARRRAGDGRHAVLGDVF